MIVQVGKKGLVKESDALKEFNPKKDKLQGFFVLLSKESKEEVLDKLDKVQVKSTHYYKGQLVLEIEYDAYWGSTLLQVTHWFIRSVQRH